MWIRAATAAEIERLARIFYVNRETAGRWNEHRREGEMRMMTGWVWTARDGSDERAGFKSVTACYIDAWYRLVAKASPPRASRARLRVVEPKPIGRVVERDGRVVAVATKRRTA